MRTKKPKSINKTLDIPASATEAEVMETVASTAEEKPNGKPKERFTLSFELNGDGSPDFSSMRESTRERAKQMFANPVFAETFGTKSVSTSVSVIDFFPIPEGAKYSPVIGSMYNTLGMLESIVAQKAGKIPQDIANKIFSYTEAEKELLAPYTARVLNKWAPLWLVKYQDEIALANLLIAINVQKFQMAAALTRMQAASQPKSEQKPENITEIPKAQPN